MPIEKITADDLRDMEYQEGLVLQGCGGEAQEWLDGINDLLTQDGILQNGNRFETVKVFQHDGLTNLLFPFEDIQVDMGKLAVWRLQTHGAFGGTWLSDYVPNRLGGFRSARQETPRPLCPLLGQDGNIFHLMGIAARVLRQNGMVAEAKETPFASDLQKQFYKTMLQARKERILDFSMRKLKKRERSAHDHDFER